MRPDTGIGEQHRHGDSADRMTTFREIGEFGFIDRIAAHGLNRSDGVICGIGDDCAVLEGPGELVLLVTSDLMVEDVHFTRDGIDPEDLGHKLLAVSLSDIAAMGGEPRDATVSLAASEDESIAFVEAIYDGLRSCAAKHGVNIVGGDTTKSPGPMVLDLTLLGRAHRDSVCLRSGARPGDLVFVSGTAGDSAAGLGLSLRELAEFCDSDRAYLVGRHTRPEPRLALGRGLADTGAVTAMIDVSDGIASDLIHICERSGVSAVVDRARIPLSPALRAYAAAAEVDSVELALTGGEDYELLFTVRSDQVGAVEAFRDVSAITRIGVIEAGPAALFEMDASGVRVPIRSRGYDHFH